MSIRAELIGDRTIRCGDTIITHRTPVLALCRELVAQGHSGHLDVFRGERRVFKPINIAWAATRTLQEHDVHGFRWREYQPFKGIHN